MLGTLSENLTSYGSLTRSNVSSLIRDMKLDKIQFNSLISKMSSYSSGSQFLTQKVGAGIELNREILVEMFRDSSLRVAKFFSGANAVGLALNSMIDVLSSEIDKVENDLNSLQIFIDNYEYLSGKDDLYNNNYIEKFDTLQNHYKYDGHNFLIKDKDGTNFPIEGNLLIDYTKGLIGINNSFTVKNIINNIMSVRIHSNYESNISSQTSFNNVFTENKQDAWTTTIKSKSILSSTLPLYDQYILYSQVGINGARAAVEITFNSVVSANQIRINPNFTKGMQLLQVIIFSPSEQNTNSNNSSQNYILALNAPKSLDVTTDIFFERKNINKVIFIFNQQIYSRSKLVPVTSELNSKLINEFVNEKMQEKRNKFSMLQDIVYTYFKNQTTIKGITKNSITTDRFYSYRFPAETNKYLQLISDEIFRVNNYDFDDRKLITQSPVFVDLFYSMLAHMNKDVFESYSNFYVETNENRLSQILSNHPAFITSANTNARNNEKYQFYNAIREIGDSSDAVKKLLVNESSDSYEYNFSINSIDFYESSNQINTKACYVSKKIPVDGQIIGAKADIKIDNETLENVTINNLIYPVSYELSISNEEIPVEDSSWIPILPKSKDKVDAEVAFFDTTDYSYKLRFIAKQDTVVLYKNGIRCAPSNYQYSITSNRITINQTSMYSPNDIFTVSYTVNTLIKNPYEIDLNANGIYKNLVRRYSTSNGYGQQFVATDINSSITLEYNPYINQEYANNSRYISGFGTVFSNETESFSYSPVRIKLSNGSFARNITNYSNKIEKVSFYNTDLILFIHNGKSIIFNKPINSSFTVDYEYVPYNFRFRLIMRQTIPNISTSSRADAVMLKLKTIKFDNYYNNLNKSYTE